MLDDYIQHLKECDNKSLMARIYGIYSIKTSVYDTVYVMLMQNTAHLKDKNNPQMWFDIKGSSINRKVEFSSENRKWWTKKGKIKGYKKVMKDMNFEEINKDLNYTLVNFSNEQKDEFRHMLEQDSKFLSKYGIMDYSLLLVLENEPISSKRTSNNFDLKGTLK